MRGLPHWAGDAVVGVALAALGSFVGGTMSIAGLMAVGPLLADAMLAVGPAAEFVLMVAALLVVSAVSNSPPVKTLAMIVLGLALGSVGLDQLTAYPRFTFGSLDLTDGVSFVALSIGMFGISEILLSLDEATPQAPRAPRLRDLPPTLAEIKEATPAVLRGSLIGFLFGLVPGVSHIISAFVSYAVEKRFSRHPEKFGQGAVAGVAGPETANNAATGASMIPLLVLGIPAIPATAILLSALLIHGVQPGPLLMSEHPQVFWGLIASLYLGNAILLVLNLPLVGLFVSLLRTPMGFLAPLVLVVCVIGVYSIKASPLDLAILVAAGLAGYLLREFSYDVAPLLLAFVLGDRMELSFRRALTISDGDYAAFVQGPAARVFIAVLAAVGALKAIAMLLGRQTQTEASKAER